MSRYQSQNHKKSTHAKLRSLNSFVMYEVKAALESLVVGEEGEASHHPDRGGCGVPCDQHQVQCRGHQRVVQAVHSGVPPGGSNTHTLLTDTGVWNAWRNIGSHRPYGFKNVTAQTGAGLIWNDQISFQGQLEKNKVEEMLEGLLPGETVDTVSNLIFSTFDKDNRGSLSFVEFVSSIHCMSNSSPEVRSVSTNCQDLDLIYNSPQTQIVIPNQARAESILIYFRKSGTHHDIAFDFYVSSKSNQQEF